MNAAGQYLMCIYDQQLTGQLSLCWTKYNETEENEKKTDERDIS